MYKIEECVEKQELKTKYEFEESFGGTETRSEDGEGGW